MKVYLKAFLITTVISMIFLSAFWYWRQSQFTSESSNRLSAIDRLETEGVGRFDFTDIEGKSLSFSSYKGRAVIVNFWASWCGPCIEEVPSMIKLIKEMGGSVQLLAISADNSMEDIQIFLKSFPDIKDPNIVVVWDKERTFMKKFDVARLPESFVIGKDGKLIKKVVGTINWYTPDSISYMKEILK